MDGDPATRWCASGASPDQWLMLDLGVRAGPWLDLHPLGAEGAYRFAVEGSQDGRQWQMLADKTQNSETGQTDEARL